MSPTDWLKSAQRGLCTFSHFSFDIRFFLLLGISGSRKKFLTDVHFIKLLINKSFEKWIFIFILFFFFFVSRINIVHCKSLNYVNNYRFIEEYKKKKKNWPSFETRMIRLDERCNKYLLISKGDVCTMLNKRKKAPEIP